MYEEFSSFPFFWFIFWFHTVLSVQWSISLTPLYIYYLPSECTFTIAISLSRPLREQTQKQQNLFSLAAYLYVCVCTTCGNPIQYTFIVTTVYHIIICDRIDLFALVGVNYGEHGFYDSLSFDSMVFFDPSFVVFVSFCRMLLLLFGWPLVVRHHPQSWSIDRCCALWESYHRRTRTFLCV